MKITIDDWNLGHLHTHLQAAAELEAWTIPYYLSTMFSIVDDTSEAYALIKSVANQEMLHLQLVSNIANAYGYSPVITPDVFKFEGKTIPHLDFSLDPGGPAEQFGPYSAEIGPLDELRINAMCLIEYPEWETGGRPDLHDDIGEYGSIGEFYDALEYGAIQLTHHIKGGVNQIDWFSSFYPEMPTMTVTASGAAGFAEVALLMEVIRDQGEAAKSADEVKGPFRSIQDDPDPAASHFQKFVSIREKGLPETHPVKDPAEYTPDDVQCRETLITNFAGLTAALTKFLGGGDWHDFSDRMNSIDSDILACWKNGVTPQYYLPVHHAVPAGRSV